MLKQINHTELVLIPKTSQAQSVEEFRQIACCNVFYKRISKIIASRLSGVLSNLIDPAQTAFIGGRCITDNIHLAQELLRQYTRKRISPRCMISVDLQKAYDTVSWEFLQEPWDFLTDLQRG